MSTHYTNFHVELSKIDSFLFTGTLNHNQKKKKMTLWQVKYEPRHEKTGFLHMWKQRRRSAVL